MYFIGKEKETKNGNKTNFALGKVGFFKGKNSHQSSKNVKLDTTYSANE